MIRIATCALAVSVLSVQALAADPPAGPPPMPPISYQMRTEEPPGDRLATDRDGAALFSSHCGECHLPWGMGTNLLTKQRTALGEPPEKGLLVNRTDLTADDVRTVVREGRVRCRV